MGYRTRGQSARCELFQVPGATIPELDRNCRAPRTERLGTSFGQVMGWKLPSGPVGPCDRLLRWGTGGAPGPGGGPNGTFVWRQAFGHEVRLKGRVSSIVRVPWPVLLFPPRLGSGCTWARQAGTW